MANIKEKAASFFMKAKLKAKEAAPTAMIFGGTGLLIGAGVWACVKTATRVEGVLDEHNQTMADLREIRQRIADGEEIKRPNGEPYTMDTYKKTVTARYIETGKQMFRIYIGPVSMAAAGAILIGVGTKTINNRRIASAVDAMATRQALKDYRQRVRDDVGEEHEKELFYNAAKQIVTEEVIDPETGEMVTKSETKPVTKGAKTDDVYCYIFDELNAPNTWNKHPGYNFMFLMQMQNTANEYLRTHGAITLYDVLKQLGMRDIPAETMTLGWLVDNPTGYGDGYVDFGICPLGDYDDVGCFKGGTPNYVLNFNCDGDIQVALKMKQEKGR